MGTVCVMSDVIALEKSGVCPFSGQKCDGTMNIPWTGDYVLTHISKVCLSRGQKAVFIKVDPEDLPEVAEGDTVLMIQANGTKVFITGDR